MIADALAVHRARCLALLTARGADGATTAELSDPAVGGHEGPRRVRELRAAGHPVHAAKLASGYWKYWIDPTGPDPQGDLPWDDLDDADARAAS
jgi:hypothetical protein